MSNQNPYALLNRKPHAQSDYDRKVEEKLWEEMGLADKGRKQKDLTKTVTEELSEDDDFLDGVFGKKKKK